MDAGVGQILLILKILLILSEIEQISMSAESKQGVYNPKDAGFLLFAPLRLGVRINKSADARFRT